MHPEKSRKMMVYLISNKHYVTTSVCHIFPKYFVNSFLMALHNVKLLDTDFLLDGNWLHHQ